MPGTIGPDVARAALALRRSHPQASARDVLDVCLRQRTGSVDDFGPDIEAGQPFALLVAEAFDKAMTPHDWAAAANPNADPALTQALRQIWRVQVLPRFAAAYGLTR